MGHVSHPAFNSADPIFVRMKTVDLFRVQGDSRGASGPASVHSIAGVASLSFLINRSGPII